MLISQELADAFNEQIGHEFGASLQYVSIAGHFDRQRLTLLSKLFSCGVSSRSIRSCAPRAGRR